MRCSGGGGINHKNQPPQGITRKVVFLDTDQKILHPQKNLYKK